MLLEQYAHMFASEKHSGHMDDSGRPYFNAHIEHSVRILMASFVDELHIDSAMIAALYMHDVIEHGFATDSEIFNYLTGVGIDSDTACDVVNLVVAVTHVGEKEDGIDNRYFPHLDGNPRAIRLKFCDRLSNITRGDGWTRERYNEYVGSSKFWKSSPSDATSSS